MSNHNITRLEANDELKFHRRLQRKIRRALKFLAPAMSLSKREKLAIKSKDSALAFPLSEVLELFKIPASLIDTKATHLVVLQSRVTIEKLGRKPGQSSVIIVPACEVPQLAAAGDHAAQRKFEIVPFLDAAEVRNEVIGKQWPNQVVVEGFEKAGLDSPLIITLEG